MPRSDEIIRQPDLNLSKTEEGVKERRFEFDDEVAKGKFAEIILKDFNIFYTDQEGKKERLVNIEINSPVMQMFFLLQGISSAKHKERGAFHVIKENEHNMVYRPKFKGQYLLGKEKLSNFGVQLSENFFSRLIDENSRALSGISESIRKNREMFLEPDGNMSITPEMKKIIFDIINCSRTGFMKRLFLESKIIELFMLQVEQTEKNRSLGNGKSLNRVDIEKLYAARDFLEQNILREITLPDVCRYAGLNDFKLKKGFKELFGTTVFGYLNNLRMEYARHLLLDEKKPVYETSMILGYSEPHHFSAAFKRKYGYLPSEIKSR